MTTVDHAEQQLAALGRLAVGVLEYTARDVPGRRLTQLQAFASELEVVCWELEVLFASSTAAAAPHALAAVHQWLARFEAFVRATEQARTALSGFWHNGSCARLAGPLHRVRSFSVAAGAAHPIVAPSSSVHVLKDAATEQLRSTLAVLRAADEVVADWAGQAAPARPDLQARFAALRGRCAEAASRLSARCAGRPAGARAWDHGHFVTELLRMERGEGVKLEDQKEVLRWPNDGN